MILLTSLHKLIDKLYTFRFYLLLITLLLNFFITPLVFHPFLKIVFRIVTSAGLMLAGANFIQRDKILLRNVWFVFGMLIIGMVTFSNLKPETFGIELTQYIMLFLFFFVITINLLQQIFSIKEVTTDVIVGSFCGYILIGIISFFLFVLIDLSIPDAFSGLSTDFDNKISDLFYFAFTCLTTLGFGDILSTEEISQKLAVFTAAVGQFYIAVLVAILVSRLLHRDNIK
jgi:voltage-gated potassium channel